MAMLDGISTLVIMLDATAALSAGKPLRKSESCSWYMGVILKGPDLVVLRSLLRTA